MLSITDSVIDSNSGRSSGGGINIDAGSITLTSTVISNNILTNGGGGAGINANQGTGTLTNVAIVNNHACQGCFGGGINTWGNNGNLILEKVSITGNTSNAGGGIFIENNATVSISDSLVNGNSANAGGGGILIGSGTLNSTNVTWAANRTLSLLAGGGGIQFGTAQVNLFNSTIVANMTGSGGGGGVRNGNGTATGTVNVHNSIIADNVATAGSAPDVFGTINSQGYNLIEDPRGATLTGIETGNILGQDARLAPLLNNGGFSETVALQATSPALDAGDPNDFPSIDQRGQPRPVDGDLNGTALPDIGAYERQPVTFTVTKTEDTNDGVCDADCSLREAVGAVNASSEIDKEIIFDDSFLVPRTLGISSELVVSNPAGTAAISGRGAEQTNVSASGLSRLISNQGGATLMLSDLTLKEGNGAGALNTGRGGAIVNMSGSLSLSACRITNNTSGISEGGGIYNTQGILKVFASTISNNSTQVAAGGISNNAAGTMELHDTYVSNNASLVGGGIENSGVLSVFDSELSYNYAVGEGGAIDNRGTCSVSGSTIDNNRTEQDEGSGVLNYGTNGTMTMLNSTIGLNTPKGGVANRGGMFTATHLTVAFNAGGGVHNYNGGTFVAKDLLSAHNADFGTSDFVGNLQSQGFNLIFDATGATISGVTNTNIIGRDPLLDPRLRLNGGRTRTYALNRQSPAIDKGGSTTPLTSVDQRGIMRPFDFPTIPNAIGGNASDIGAFERQLVDPSGSAPFDFDGDGLTDISVFRPSTAAWYLQLSTVGSRGAEFGVASDRLAPADYDGDGMTDIAVYRPETGIWYVFNMEEGTTSYYVFGLPEDLPTPADYDGDGKADISVFRPSTGTWYRQNSSDGSFFGMQFGASEDKPTLGDFDGDGKADIAVFRPSNGAWYQVNSSDGSLFGELFGFGTDVTVPADYDGDGKTDLAVFRPSNGFWYIKNSNGAVYTAYPFGLADDIPAPGDFDGDGKADLSVFRPSDGNWYRLNSSDGSFFAYQFGTNGDKPTQAAFRY